VRFLKEYLYHFQIKWGMKISQPDVWMSNLTDQTDQPGRLTSRIIPTTSRILTTSLIVLTLSHINQITARIVQTLSHINQIATRIDLTLGPISPIINHMVNRQDGLSLIVRIICRTVMTLQVLTTQTTNRIRQLTTNLLMIHNRTRHSLQVTLEIMWHSNPTTGLTGTTINRTYTKFLHRIVPTVVH
jgi:hypothetical protein